MRRPGRGLASSGGDVRAVGLVVVELAGVHLGVHAVAHFGGLGAAQTEPRF
jgi:hypothetical protein